jgi:hypothetical protein
MDPVENPVVEPIANVSTDFQDLTMLIRKTSISPHQRLPLENRMYHAASIINAFLV